MLLAKNVIFAAGAVAVFVAAVETMPLYFVYLCTTGVITAIIVRSLGLLTGQAGLISLCHMTFAAIGAWVSCWLGIHAPGIPLPVTLVVAAGAGLLTGVLVGLPALRLRGLNLAAITLTFAVAVDAVFSTIGFPGNESVTAFNRTSPFIGDRSFLLLCGFALAACVLGLNWLSGCRVGGVWAAIRFSERASAALGLSVASGKLTAFSVSAAISGLGGGLLAAQLGVLTASNFSPLSSLSIFALTIFVGGQYWEGAILGGLLVIGVPELLRRFGLPLDLDAIIFAVGAIDALRKRNSVAGALRTLLARKRRKTFAVEVGAVREPVAGVSAGAKAAGQLSITGLNVKYGEVHAVQDFALSVPPGSIVGLVGPNGAGKSTIIDAVSGFLPQAYGDISLNQVSMVGLGPANRSRAGIRRTFQQGRSIPDLTVGQYMRLSAGSGASDCELETILAHLSAPPMSAPIAEMEIGLRRIVEIAAGIAAKPQILLLDEPAAGLSATQSNDLARQIRMIPKLFGCACVIVEHDMDLVRSVCDTITVIDFGRVIASGTPAEVLARQDVQEAYLGAA